MKGLKTTQKQGTAAACLGATSTSTYKAFGVVWSHVPSRPEG